MHVHVCNHDTVHVDTFSEVDSVISTERVAVAVRVHVHVQHCTLPTAVASSTADY